MQYCCTENAKTYVTSVIYAFWYVADSVNRRSRTSEHFYAANTKWLQKFNSIIGARYANKMNALILWKMMHFARMKIFFCFVVVRMNRISLEKSELICNNRQRNWIFCNERFSRLNEWKKNRSKLSE